MEVLKEEMFKFRKWKTPFYSILVLIILMLYTTVSDQSLKILETGFASNQWIPIILSVVTSSFVAMEYGNRTILLLLYKNSKKINIYLSKFIVSFLYLIVLLCITFIITFLFKSIFYVQEQSTWLSGGMHSILIGFLSKMLGTCVYSVFIISLTMLLIVLIKDNMIVIGTEIGIIFLGAPLSDGIMRAFPQAVDFLKWNPFNMILIINHLNDAGKYVGSLPITGIKLFIANIIYSVFFLALGYLVFVKKRI
ncbi:ABC transporter permease [Pediococcus acidilactici]|uniref:ABC transporter permease n=1 Tax=Pediococcus acidilactici TaxID=1254 RepID=UPI00194EC605|nr:ABC transporter permease [Pediococcus acidilactici]MBM6586266.1 ABC transporter permease [Pediococcus acidilactici]